MSGGSAERARALGSEALVHHRAGRLDEAEALYRRLLEIDPDNVDALWLLGTLRAHRGDPEEAEAQFRSALDRDPRHVPALLGTASLRLAAGQVDEALAALNRALAVDPRSPNVQDGLARALALKGRWKEALDHGRRALEAHPDHPALHGRLAAILLNVGQPGEAEPHARKAAAGEPRNPDHQTNLGLALQRLGRHEEAIESFERAVALAPGHADACANLGTACLAALRPEEAVVHLRDAVAANPDHAPSWHNLLFARTYLPDLDLDACLDERRAWGERVIARAGAPTGPPAPGADETDRVLRVGYLSPDFRAHPVGFFIEPVLEHHDRSRVSVTCYANVARPDGVTRRMRSHADHWREITGLTDAEVAARVRNDGIDILIDLAGHAAGTRLPVLAHRPAPLQGSYLGDPLTSGLATVDFRLTDAWADPPDAGRWYTEALARVAGGFCCYRMPYPAPPVTPLPAMALGHVTFGCLMHPGKINRRVIALWSEVLRAVPEARLLLFRHDFASPWLRERFAAAFRVEGIAPERVTCEGRIADNRAYLDVYGRIDVALDTFPFCGHTTTCEALWMGVPVVTLAGRCFAERMGVSLLHQVGLEDLVADDGEAFVAAARALAGDLTALAELRAGLRARMAASRLCDAPGFVAALEAVYRELWVGRCRGGGDVA